MHSVFADGLCAAAGHPPPTPGGVRAPRPGAGSGRDQVRTRSPGSRLPPAGSTPPARAAAAGATLSRRSHDRAPEQGPEGAAGPDLARRQRPSQLLELAASSASAQVKCVLRAQTCFADGGQTTGSTRRGAPLRSGQIARSVSRPPPTSGRRRRRRAYVATSRRPAEERLAEAGPKRRPIRRCR